MLDRDLLAFIRGALPPPPARVLEVGAGAGELAAELTDWGYDVLAIDPASENPAVRRVALHELDASSADFDAAVAVVSLHHVQPLAESMRRLAELVRPGGTLVVDEIDFERLDDRAARWWLDRHPEHSHTPSGMVADLRGHMHSLAGVRAALEEWFELTAAVRVPYLYRWDMPPGVRAAEEQLIAAGELPATGARFVGRLKEPSPRPEGHGDG